MMERHSEGEGAKGNRVGRKAFDEDEFEAALAHLETALQLNDNPDWYSYVG
jgi:hypothetical protein